MRSSATWLGQHYRSITLVDRQPLLTDEMLAFHRLQIANDDVFQKPRRRMSRVLKCRATPSCSSERLTIFAGTIGEGSLMEIAPMLLINIRRNRNNERVDSTALQNLAMGISQTCVHRYRLCHQTE